MAPQNPRLEPTPIKMQKSNQRFQTLIYHLGTPLDSGSDKSVQTGLEHIQNKLQHLTITAVLTQQIKLHFDLRLLVSKQCR